MRLFLSLLLPLASFSFALGLTLPLMRFEKLYFFEETPSLIDIIIELAAGQDTALALLVGSFSVLLPAVKLLLLHVVAFGGGRGRSLALLSAVGKWSMMDVMLVALVVFAAKTSGLASAVTQTGIWFYATATLSSALAALICQRGR